jgi:hypothetical protein
MCIWPLGLTSSKTAESLLSNMVRWMTGCWVLPSLTLIVVPMRRTSDGGTWSLSHLPRLLVYVRARAQIAVSCNERLISHESIPSTGYLIPLVLD